MLKVNGKKMIFLANGKKKRAGVTTITADKIDFKSKTVSRDHEVSRGQYVMIKGSVQNENIAKINMCTKHQST